MELIEVTRKSFRAQAVRVTDENIHEVAAWCDGLVTSTSLVAPDVVWYIELLRWSGKSIAKRQFAFSGQWITKNGEQYTVYKHAQFMGTFDQPREKNLELAYKRGQLIGVLVDMLSQNTDTAEEIQKAAYERADEIMKIFGE